MNESGSFNDVIDLQQAADSALSSLLPEKSRGKYEKSYNDFKKWCDRNKVDVINETVLVAYFSTELKQIKCSTAWSIYSMLKLTLNLKENIDIMGFNNLRAFLKRKTDGYKPKKSKTFTKEEVFRFIKEAPDNEFLGVKIALIVGVYGACRRHELVNLGLHNIQYLENEYGIKVTLPTTKKNIIRQFVIDEGDDPDMNLIQIFKKYAALRPHNVPDTRFFMCYRNGKCTTQPTGIHAIGSYPQQIASFLGLENPTEYTGHCFRRSSVAEDYVESSVNNKRKIGVQTLGTKHVKTNDEATSSTVNSCDLVFVPVQNNFTEPFDAIKIEPLDVIKTEPIDAITIEPLEEINIEPPDEITIESLDVIKTEPLDPLQRY